MKKKVLGWFLIILSVGTLIAAASSFELMVTAWGWLMIGLTLWGGIWLVKRGGGRIYARLLHGSGETEMVGPFSSEEKGLKWYNTKEEWGDIRGVEFVRQ